ncbi:MAG: hypothetical protein AAGF31_02400 [Planctomycetota bacterium]
MAWGRTGKRTHRRDRVMRRFLYVVAAGALLVFFAPMIVGNTPLLGSFLARAMPAEAGKLSVGSASLGWFSPVTLYRVQVTDPQGRVVMHADEVRVDRSLMALASDSSDLGVVTVNRPALYAFVRPDGSNLEDLAAAFSPAAEQEELGEVPASKPTRLTLAINSGAIAVTDAISGQTQIHDPIDVQVSLDDGVRSLDLSGVANAVVLPAGAALPVLPLATQQDRGGGEFNVKLAPAATGANEASIRLAGVDLAAASPWLRRLDSTLALTGLAEGEGSLSWWPAGGAAAGLEKPMTSRGRLRITGLQVASQSLGDTISSSQVDLPWRVTTGAGGRVTVQQLGLNSDFAEANLVGDFSRAEVDALMAGDWWAPRTARLTADVDLARLARISPRALHLQQGVTLSSGRVQLAAESQPDGGGRAISAKLATADLVAQRNGRPLRWGQPIQLDLAARESDGNLAISRLACVSSFLNGSVSGDLTNLTGSAQLNLDQLVADTQQLFDYGPWRLSGKADAQVQLARVGASGFRTTGNANVDGCVISYDDRPVVLERKLAITFGGEGQTDPATLQPMSLATGTLNVISGGDRLDVKLIEPANLNAETFALDLQLVGDVANWLRRVKSLAPAEDAESLLATLQAAGAIDAQARGRFGAERVEIANANVTATDVRLQAESLDINEPRVEFSGDLAWDAASGAVASRAGQFVSGAVAMRARDLQWQDSQARGEAAIRADLVRLGRWAPGVLGDRQLAGQLTGGVRLGGSQATSGATATIDLTAQQFAISEPAANGQLAVLWQEPTLRMRGGLTHAAADDRLTIAGMAIQSQNLSGVVNGQVDRLSTAPSPQLNGTIDYDLARLGPVIASYAGPGVVLSGKHQAQFELAPVAAANPAAHWSRRWTGRLQAPWTSASLYGLPVGQGVLNASLAGGQLRTEPLQFAVGQGAANLQPIVQFDPPPAAWGMPAGDVLTNVLITPEISERMLKFIAPVLADATRSQGQFSLRTDGVRAPLGDASQVETSGQLTIRNLRVTPGPGVAGWVSAARTVEALAKDRDPTALAARPTPTLLSISERAVNFQIARGRVYHQGLQFDVDGVPVSSAGSVGFDETLQFTLTVPIQDRWIAGEQRLVGLRGQALQLPVTGTLSDPKIDRNQLRQFSQQLIQSGIRGAVENELGRALEKLFN